MLPSHWATDLCLSEFIYSIHRCIFPRFIASKVFRVVNCAKEKQLSDQKKLVRPAYVRGLSRNHTSVCPVLQILHLQHDHADLLDTLDDGFWGAGDCHCTLCGVGQHVARHLDLGAGGLQETIRRQSGDDNNNSELTGQPVSLCGSRRRMWTGFFFGIST